MSKPVTRAMSILWIALRVWVGWKYLMEGFEKFENLDHLAGKSSPFLDFYLSMDDTGYMLPLIGVIEIVGALLLITQRYSFTGALLLLPVALNVFLAHLNLIQNPKGMILTGAYLLVIILLILKERDRLKTLVKPIAVWPTGKKTED